MKRLVFRLSSLGDVILATAALESFSEKVDWVVAEEFAEILEGHPKINRIWRFDRRGLDGGLLGWLKLCRVLWEEGYDEIYDLHASLRTQLARLLFFLWSFNCSTKLALWKGIQKNRHLNWGYFIFKRNWPKHLRPQSKREGFTKLTGGRGGEVPSLSYLAQAPVEVPTTPYVCVMPASRWEGKEWPTSFYVTLLQSLGIRAVILGTAKDRASESLVAALKAANVEHFSGIGKWDIKQTASVLIKAKAYLGSDTGLAHLAEAVGTPAWMLFGPTKADMGFGPYKKESIAIESPIWCSPCGKDGRFCFRVTDRYLCQRMLKPQIAIEKIKPLL